MRTQDWFEMRELRRRKLSQSVWIPLHACEVTKFEDGAEETFAAGCVAFPPQHRAQAETFGWSDIGLGHSGGPFAYKDRPYKIAETFQYHEGADIGVDLIFDQLVGCDLGTIRHINQDLIIALNLIQEGDIWVRPQEDYVTVVRKRRNETGRVIAIEIKSEFLRDYLAARGLSLRIAVYRERLATLPDAGHISWRDKGLYESNPNDRFEARVAVVDASGMSYGAGVALFQAWRTDVDHGEDVPVFGPETASNTDGRSTSHKRGGVKRYRVQGELWREEWIEPSTRSERVRGDDATEIISFIVDAAGTRETNLTLNDEDVGRYLWFRPNIVPVLKNLRGGGLLWYTLHTGSIWANSDWPVHFGLNQLGLVTVYAHDVARLPVWQQRLWAAHNVSPDGGVSSELLSAQMETRPARTEAPEAILSELMEKLNGTFTEWSGEALFQDHSAASDIVDGVHRFRTLEPRGAYALAKDLARLIIDRVSVRALQRLAPLAPGEKRGSLKSIERALATFLPKEEAKRLLSPLVGIYELRLGDAHLPSNEIGAAFDLVGVDQSALPIDLGREMILSAVLALESIGRAVGNHLHSH